MKFLLVVIILIMIFISLISSEGRWNRRRVKKEKSEPVKANLQRQVRQVVKNDEEDVEDSDTLTLTPSPTPNAKLLDETRRKNTMSPEIFEINLPVGYNKYDIPKDKDGNPLKVYIQLTIWKILDFDELAENIKIDVEFRVLWTDYKIRDLYNEVRVQKQDAPLTIESLTPEERKNMTLTLNNPNLLNSVWKPNLFFENLLQVKQPAVMSKPVTLKIIPEVGWFEYLTRILVVTDCPMEFRYYPADTQICKFGIRGFSYTKKDLLLGWYKSGVWLDELTMSSFDVKIDNLREIFLLEDEDVAISNKFDVLVFNIQTRRRLSYHLVQTYIASTFYMIITCLCFLLPARFVEARIGISMTTLLTLTAMFGAVRESTPIVSYVKAIDTWMVGCIIFVFLTLTEFTFHTWLQAKKEEHEENYGEKRASELVPFTGRSDTGLDDRSVDAGELRNRRLSSGSKTSKTVKIDEGFHKKRAESYAKYITIMETYSFIFFLVVIAVYTAIYWTWLLLSAKYFDWSVNEANNNVPGITLEEVL